MLILIAESKTMLPCDGVAAGRRPVFDARAGELMLSLSELDAAELSREVKISLSLAGKLRGMIRDFPDKSTGAEAIRAFTGVVFKAFDYGSLSEDARRRCCGDVRIVSSLYGWLRPDDVVKAYRFDFTSRVAPDGGSLAAMWQEAVTRQLLEELRTSGETEVLDLLPGDAARCIDWKRVQAVAEVRKADFIETGAGGKERTPNSGRLKTLRGRLLRQIVTEGIKNFSELTSVSSESYMARASQPDSGSIILDTAAG